MGRAGNEQQQLDRLETLRQVDAQMVRVRWFAVAFVLVQFVLYEPPPGLVVPFPRLAMGLIIAALLVSINLVSVAARRIDDARRLSRIGSCLLAADALLALGIVWLFSFDNLSALWALLIIPVIEGAMRTQARGAFLTWAGCAVAYIAHEFWASRAFPYIEFQVPSVTYRLFMILIVAAATGYLAKNLQSRVADHRSARRESEHRAELLRTVAASGRTMATTDIDTVLNTVADAALGLGFAVGAIAIFEDDGKKFRLVNARGVPEPFASETHPSSAGIVGRVRTHRDTQVIEDYSEWPGGLDELRGLHLRAVAASPIWSGGEIEAVLIVGSQQSSTVSSDEVDCLTLLSTQAGGALTNAYRFAEHKRLEQQLHHEAFHDSLTGLPNRALFLDRLGHCLERKARSPSPTAVLFVDLDGFKRVNDSLGHEAGDELLQDVSRRLQRRRRVGDTVARWGGDEFTILVEEPLSEEAAIEAARRILKELRDPFKAGAREVFISASIGVAYGSRAPGKGLELLREADVAMYRAKEQGGGHCEPYRPAMIARAEHRMDLELELHQGLEGGEFLMYYQPAVSISTGKVVALEALARWKHPERGIVPAREFIALAEERDLIIKMGHWVLDEVCRQIGCWQKTYPQWPRMPVGINLSTKELRQPDLVDAVVMAMQSHGVAANDIAFEITERALIDTGGAMDQMRALHALGLRMAIDDFGLGYSSLSYLKRFPFSILKIDKSFVTGITESPADQAIVRSVLGLAKELEMAVVAEGVETQEQLDYLRELGCEYVQGYYLHRPLDAATVTELLTQPAYA